MKKQILIEASNPYETRVAVLNNGQLEEFEFELEHKKSIKSNIYLAKVVRIEPSLQAAFVNYGGGRQGFLSFSEIHPDYFQISLHERENILREWQKYQEELNLEEDDEEEQFESSENFYSEDETPDDYGKLASDVDSFIIRSRYRRKPASFHRRYKIQDVIKPRQVLLVQIDKEERATKGAALTTYISIAGRYCVLMPKSSRGVVSISRKMSLPERNKMKEAIADIEIPKDMGLIIRTAGANHSKDDIQRDVKYLLNLWNSIKELTMISRAPALIYNEADIIKRTLRDVCQKDTGAIIIEGEEGYKKAMSFFKTLSPAIAEKIEQYHNDGVNLFKYYHVDSQIEQAYHPVVKLKSGGSIVISPTEALVAIDVNSGKLKGEKNVRETAIKTNLEAAEEIARQIKLRDLGGLIVIDFIDMDNSKYNYKVEKQLKDSLKLDKAKLQIGKISQFGLLELSRQRLRNNITENIFMPCSSCMGSGLVKSEDAAVLDLVRSIENEACNNRGSEIRILINHDILVPLFNYHKNRLVDIEKNYGVTVILTGDHHLKWGEFDIEVINNSSTFTMRNYYVNYENTYNNEVEIVDPSAISEPKPKEEPVEEETSYPKRRYNNRRRFPKTTRSYNNRRFSRNKDTEYNSSEPEYIIREEKPNEMHDIPMEEEHKVEVEEIVASTEVPQDKPRNKPYRGKRNNNMRNMRGHRRREDRFFKETGESVNVVEEPSQLVEEKGVKISEDKKVIRRGRKPSKPRDEITNINKRNVVRESEPKEVPRNDDSKNERWWNKILK